MPAATQAVRLTELAQSSGYQAVLCLNRLIRLFLNMLLSDAAVGIGTTTSTARTVATANFLIDGEFKTKAATDNLWVLSGSTVPVSSWQKYLLLLDAAGAASFLAGTPSRVSAAAVVLPPPPDSRSIIGVLTVATNASTPFVPGTTLLGAAGITSTFVDGIDPSLIPLIKDGLSNTVVLT